MLLVAATLLVACTADPAPTAQNSGRHGPSGAPSTVDPAPTAQESGRPGPSGSPTTADPSATGTAEPVEPPADGGPPFFRAGAAMRDVRALAGRIGPRLATAPAFDEAADLVAGRFTALGYAVERQRFPVPAGDSWGVPVAAGRSHNVIATPPGFEPTEPHLVVGAHLDTVAVAPGAEDNASGVAVLLEVARLAAQQSTRMPVVFVAFGAEEPRGPGDDMHHFGSQHYVRELPRAQRAALQGMVSLDRVGVGDVVPVCTGPLSPPRLRDALLRTAEREGIPAQPCENTASDHWSFEKDGAVVARLGSTSYAQYHSAEDVPRVVDPRQLGRTGRLAWAWLRAR